MATYPPEKNVIQVRNFTILAGSDIFKKQLTNRICNSK